MTDEITQRVIQTIAKNQHLADGAVTAESTFQELGIDSLDGLHILFALEEEFGIDIPDDAGREFISIAQASEGIRTLLARKNAPVASEA